MAKVSAISGKINVLSRYSGNIKSHRLYDRTVGITAEFESHALGLIINYEQGGLESEVSSP